MNTQEAVDKFYLSGDKKPCCAGCDNWRFHNSIVGDCVKSAPVSGAYRADMIGISSSSLRVDSGHIMTLRDHACGDFIDTYDWEKRL